MSHPEGKVIALGFFDGVHAGHAALLRMALKRAEERQLIPYVMSFDRHPDDLVAGSPTMLINTAEDRIGILSRCYGIEHVIMAHFDENMMHMPWDTFIEDYLVRQHGARHLVCGYDFRFGDKGYGNPERLQAKCAELGIGCDVIPSFRMDGEVVSSTLIRGLLQAGEMERAASFLSHPHCLTGEVVHGKQLGRTIGIPTANLLIPAGVLVPAFGVYATRVILPEGEGRMAVTNVGVRPTVEDSTVVTVEPWILDFSGDLYGKQIRVEFYKMLRGERRFDGLAALQQEIFRNAEETRAWFASHVKENA